MPIVAHKTKFPIPFPSKRDLASHCAGQFITYTGETEVAYGNVLLWSWSGLRRHVRKIKKELALLPKVTLWFS